MEPVRARTSLSYCRPTDKPRASFLIVQFGRPWDRLVDFGALIWSGVVADLVGFAMVALRLTERILFVFGKLVTMQVD
jgi:hypothetical protein